jgi:heme/copper-type cytochrome/quinol oxidase subunit 2
MYRFIIGAAVLLIALFAGKPLIMALRRWLETGSAKSAGMSFWLELYQIVKDTFFIILEAFRKLTSRKPPPPTSGTSDPKLKVSWQLVTTILVVTVVVLAVLVGIYFSYKTEFFGLFGSTAGPTTNPTQVVNGVTTPTTSVVPQTTQAVQTNQAPSTTKKTSGATNVILGVLVFFLGVLGIGGLIFFGVKSGKNREKWGKAVPWEYFFGLIVLNLIAWALFPSVWIPWWKHPEQFWPMNVGILATATFFKKGYRIVGLSILLILIAATFGIVRKSGWWYRNITVPVQNSSLPARTYRKVILVRAGEISEMIDTSNYITCSCVPDGCVKVIPDMNPNPELWPRYCPGQKELPLGPTSRLQFIPDCGRDVEITITYTL